MDRLTEILDSKKDFSDKDLDQLVKIASSFPADVKFSAKSASDSLRLVPILFSATDDTFRKLEQLFELLLPVLDRSPQSFVQELKKDVEEQMDRVEKIFQKNDSRWYKIWCILSRLLGADFLHKDTLNLFLKTVESGFRSSDMAKRCESFHCWKTLLLLVVKYNEIKDPKRVKLILIPLKGSRTKTEELAEFKFDIWWSLLRALEQHLSQFENIVDDFVCFCFGPFSNNNEPLVSYLQEIPANVSVVKSFSSVRVKSIACLGAFLGVSSDTVLELAPSLALPKNSQLCSPEVFKKTANTIIAGCIEAVLLIAQLPTHQSEITEAIWKALLKHFGAETTEPFKFLCESLLRLHKVQQKQEGDVMLRKLTVQTTCMVLSLKEQVETANESNIKPLVGYLETMSKYLTQEQIRGLCEKVLTLGKFKVIPVSPVQPRRSIRNDQTSKKKEDEFVVIENVWKMDPNKLTDHQRERMKERRSDIPALYNDMSQSQDNDTSSIKPWTPGNVKLVVQPSPFKALGKAVLPVDSKNGTPKSPEKSKGATRELARLHIDTNEGAPVVDLNSKVATRRRSIGRSVKEKEPEWKKNLLKKKNSGQESSKKQSKKAKKEEKEEEKAKKENKEEPKEEKEEQKSKKEDPKKTSETPKAREEAQKTPEKLPETEVVEASQDVTPKANITGRRSRVLGSAASPLKSPMVSLKFLKPVEKDESPAKQAVPQARKLRSTSAENPATEDASMPPKPIKQTNSLDSEPRRSPRSQQDSPMKAPLKALPSPLKTLASPLKTLASPLKTLASPLTTLASPLKSTTSLVKTVELQSSLKSPQKAIVSPMVVMLDRNEVNSGSPRKSPRRAPETPEQPGEESPENRKSPRTTPRKELFSPIRSPREKVQKNLSFEDDPMGEVFEDDLVSGKGHVSVIVSSPDVSAEKTTEFLNDTNNMSPISSVKKTSVAPNQTLMQERDEANVSPTLPTEQRNSRPKRFTNIPNIQGIAQLESPKSAPGTVFQGRAAQMMNLLQKKQANTSTPIATTSKSFSGPGGDGPQHEVLVFSKTLPPASASPSSGILKRKIEDSFDDQGVKRKRVSFHDPPVSVTKEYVLQEEEMRPTSVTKQQLFGRGLGAGQNGGSSPNMNRFRYTLKRRGKRDSTNELLKQLSTGEITLKLPESAPTGEETAVSLTQTTSNQTSEPEFQYNFKTKADLFDFCASGSNFEEFLERALEKSATAFSPKVNKILTKALSNQMEADSQLCDRVLDRLSEKYAPQFLNHALQENSTKDILDRFTLQLITNYLEERVQTDQEAKVELLKKLEVWFSDESVITRQELLTFIANCMPEEASNEEICVLLDELLSEKSPREAFDLCVEHIRKAL